MTLDIIYDIDTRSEHNAIFIVSIFNYEDWSLSYLNGSCNEIESINTNCFMYN